jgi:hypothetical protein
MIPIPNIPNLTSSSVFSSITTAIFGGTDLDKDWRVRLSIPSDFKSSPVLSPIVNVGAFIFPYTPTIQLSHSANYQDIGLTHQNYNYLAYENSRADTITISGPFNVEDGAQARYWVAALHFLRSATKMYAGNDADAGNPPPILKLNAYGEYVFNNVPVVVKGFQFELPQNADYIPANDSFLGSAIGGLGQAVGGRIGGVIGGAIGNFLKNAKDSRVPTKSTLSVTLQPIYSRTAMRQFSLVDFVNGKYVKSGGYI